MKTKLLILITLYLGSKRPLVFNLVVNFTYGVCFVSPLSLRCWMLPNKGDG